MQLTVYWKDTFINALFLMSGDEKYYNRGKKVKKRNMQGIENLQDLLSLWLPAEKYSMNKYGIEQKPNK